MIAAVIEVAICLASTTFFNYKIYLAVRRHTNQIQALQLQIQEEQGHGENAANSASLQKSALGAFYVYLLFLLCYLPNICSYIFITIYGSGTRFFCLYTDSGFCQFIAKSSDLLLEDETRSTRHHGNTAENINLKRKVLLSTK